MKTTSSQIIKRFVFAASLASGMLLTGVAASAQATTTPTTTNAAATNVSLSTSSADAKAKRQAELERENAEERQVELLEMHLGTSI